jgi:hypothetical protein
MLPTNLVQLSIVGNRLTKLEKADFMMCQHSLRIVNVSRNQLTSIKGLACCHYLKDINLSENQLNDESLTVAISGLKRLKRLDTSLNRLQSGGIMSNTVASLRNLKVFRCSQNTLQGSFLLDSSRHLKLKEVYLT